MSNLLDIMNLETWYIFSIIMDDSIECMVYEPKPNSNIKYIEMGYKFFIQNVLENSTKSFWKYNKNTLYILKDGNYSDLKEIFTVIQDSKVSIVRGSSQKAHMVSPIDFRLSCYLMILCNMDYKKFKAENSFKTISKDRYLPY
uniref:Uncharacterized protein n=1 Tax=Tolypocladium cylindrosporum TaxID=38005 RepID=A0A6G7P065_9HYPO|nr:hypothetical protein [Tolypocladium cylindrosporum]QIJ60559.1 hypothetical protein [Tolypocladium cylindrosporum]